MAQISYGTITITDTTDISHIENWYLATSASSGVTRDTSGWSTTIQSMTSTNQYLWNYEKIYGTGINNNEVLISQTDPIIIGRYGQNGQPGVSITSIDEYYQATNSTTNPGSSGWTKNSLVVPTTTNRYLWNYQVINYSSGSPEGSYNDARIIGVYGDTGERGTSILKVTTAPTTTSGTISGFTYSYRMSLSTVKTQSGKNEVLVGDIIEYNSNHYQVGYVSSSYVYLSGATSIKGADGQTYYTHIRYADDSSGNNMSASPSGKTYIGVYNGTSSTAPTTTNSYTWSKYVGDSATQYYAFVKYATDSSGTNMQDNPASGYDYVGTYTGTKANPVASDFNWSKYTGEPGTPATQYYAFIKYATSGAGANMTDTPTSNTTYVGTYSGTKANPVASDYKWSVYVGANGVSVTETRELYYLKTNSTNPSQITASSQITATDRQNGWTSIVPSYVADGIYYTCIETSLSSGGPVWSVPAINNGLTNANAKALDAYNTSIARDTEINALQAQAKYFWWDSEGAHIASGLTSTDSDSNITQGTPSTYGFNALTAPGYLKLRYQNIDFAQLATNSLTFYRPAVNGSTYVQGKKAMDLTADALTFYKPLAYNSSNEPTAAAQLNSTGLNITDGSIQLGTSSSSSTTAGNITLSNSDFTRSISGTSRSNLRFAIGQYFGVKNDGTLYASNAHISGAITATSLDLTTNNVTINTSNITGLSAVATTGNYSSLNNTPDLTVYISKDGVVGTEPSGSAASNSSGFIVSSAGVLKAANAVITGKIFATSGVIGGWNIGTDTNKSLYYGNQVPGATTSNLVLSPTSAKNSNAIAGSDTNKTWFISAGRNFGVDTNGILYATGVNITGAITATSLTINNTDYASDITTISNKANSADSNWSVIITITSINYTSSTAVLQATVYHKGVKTTSGFTYAWYKNGTGNSLGSAASLTVTDLDAYYTCIIS